MNLNDTFLAYEIANQNAFVTFLQMLHITWLDNLLGKYYAWKVRRKLKAYTEFLENVKRLELSQHIGLNLDPPKIKMPSREEFEKEYFITPDVRDPLTKAVEEILPQFTGMDEYFKYAKSDFRSFCHSQLSGGIGMHIRNHFKLWDMKGEVYEYISRRDNITHPDDVSGVIIEGVYDKWRAEHGIEGVKPPTENIFSTVLPTTGRGHKSMRS